MRFAWTSLRILGFVNDNALRKSPQSRFDSLLWPQNSRKLPKSGIMTVFHRFVTKNWVKPSQHHYVGPTGPTMVAHLGPTLFCPSANSGTHVGWPIWWSAHAEPVSSPCTTYGWKRSDGWPLVRSVTADFGGQGGHWAAAHPEKIRGAQNYIFANTASAGILRDVS